MILLAAWVERLPSVVDVLLLLVRRVPSQDIRSKEYGVGARYVVLPGCERVR